MRGKVSAEINTVSDGVKFVLASVLSGVGLGLGFYIVEHIKKKVQENGR